MLMEKLRGGSVSNKLADDHSESSSLVRGGRTTRRQAGRLAAASAELLSSSTTTAVSSSQPPKSGGRTGDSNSGGGSTRSDSPSSSSPNNLKGSCNKTPGHVVVKGSATKVVSPNQNTAGGKSFREILSASPPVCVKEEYCCSATETLFPNTTITTTTTAANPISTSLSSAQPKWNLPVENDKTRDCSKKATRGRCGNKQTGNKGGCKSLESKKQGALERKNTNCGSGGDSVINSSGTSVSKDVNRSSSSTNYGNSGQSNVGEVCSDKSARSSFRLRGDTGRGGGGGGESLAWEETNFQSRPQPPPKVMTEKPKLAPMLLMNNLPYMGELTFDTRPRRGRKPKKADICHLISKNYGIQFPNSYTNSPNTGSFPATNAAPIVSAPVPKKATKKSSAARKSASATWRLSGGGGGVALDCGLPPDLVPLSTSATVPQCSLRLSLGGSSPGGVSQMNSVQSGELWGTSSKISSMYNCNNGKIREGMSCLSSKPCKMEEEEPLNLCLRDSPSNLYNSSPPPPPSPQMNTSSPIPSQSSFKSKVSVGMLQKDPSGSLTSLNMKSSLGGDSNNTSSTCDAHLVNSNVKKGEQRKNSGARGSCLNGGAQSAPASGSSNSILNQKSSPSSSSAKVKGKRKRSGGGFMPPPPPPTSSANNKFSSTPSSSTASLQDSSSKEAMEKAKAAAAYTTGNSLFGQPNSCSRAEVSICKFKFTGGAKPSLQEKKMLSVDSGGNFRFYTDKATSSSSKSFRASISSSSSRPDFDNDCQYPLSSLPKSAKSMSMCMPVPVTSMTSLSISKGESLSSFCQFPKPIETTGVASARGSSSSRVSSSSSLTSPPVSSTLPGYSKGKTKNASRSKGGEGGSSGGGGVGDGQPTTTFVSGDDSVSCSSDNSNNSNSRFSGLLAGVGNQPGETSKSGALRIRPPNTPNSNKLKLKRKRRTRKSLMREKLEKTFKEKGFLIQTQQLESAEGATYCKFRQLRKFTRYLFRSWKDYLPDNVKDIQRAPGSAPANSSPATISPAMSPTTLATHPSIGFGDGTVPQNVTQRKSGTKPERQLRNSGKFEAIEVDGDEDDGSNDEECDFDGDNEGDDCGELEQEPEDFKSEPCEEDNYLSPGDYFAHTRDESHSEDEDVDMDMDTGDHRPSIPPTSPEDDNDVDEEEDTSDSDNIDE